MYFYGGVAKRSGEIFNDGYRIIKVKFDEWNIIQAPPYIFHASNA